jgi:SAM-dependent methyltransferase
MQDIADYYTRKLAEYGETPRGVDWNGEDGQLERFSQLCRGFLHAESGFTINDVGCGYGALYEYLKNQSQVLGYFGVDISSDMILAARNRYQDEPSARFEVGRHFDNVADYSVASGIFNVRLGHSSEQWYKYIIETLDLLNLNSRLGFSFNCLTSYSDSDKLKDYLYYADPLILFDACKRRYSRKVALLHDYDLFEFTILVRK